MHLYSRRATREAIFQLLYSKLSSYMEEHVEEEDTSEQQPEMSEITDPRESAHGEVTEASIASVIFDNGNSDEMSLQLASELRWIAEARMIKKGAKSTPSQAIDEEYIQDFMSALSVHSHSVIAILTGTSSRPVTAIDTVSMAIVILAVTEALFVVPTVDKGIAIDEALRLVKKFGMRDSTRFVNGLLDKAIVVPSQ